jgi:opacity protein-like surface antigen
MWAVSGVAALAVSGMMLSAPALAADIPEVAPVEIAPPPPPAPAFSWNGPYVGVFGVGLLFTDFCEEVKVVQGASANSESCCYQPEDLYGAGVQVGFNFGNGRFLAGIEGQIGGLHIGENVLWAVAANLRAGVVLGERVLVYAEAGIGTTIDPNILFATAGGGIEVALGDRFSIFGEAKAVFLPDGPGFIGTAVFAGINLHFGR